MKNVKIILPTMQELKGRAVMASDFAVACGIRSEAVPVGDRIVNFAHACSSTIFSENNTQVAYVSLYFTEQPRYHHKIQTKATYIVDGAIKEVMIPANAGAHDLGFAPKILYPEALGMTVATRAGEDTGIIKIGDRVPTYPQSYVGATLSQKYEILAAVGELATVGHTVVDAHAQNGNRKDFDLSYDEPPAEVYHQRYRIGDAEYVRLYNTVNRTGQFADGTKVMPRQAYWFKCEPYRAIQNPDGSITCLDALVSGQLESDMHFQERLDVQLRGHPRLNALMEQDADISQLGINIDTSEFTGGDYLHEVFLKEMLQSVGISMEQPQNEQLDFGREME